MKDSVATDQGVPLMAVIEDVVAGGQDLIRHWDLLVEAREALRLEGPSGLARYYQAAIDRPGARATWVRATLQAHGRKTLESEYPRFLAVYRAGHAE